jgi:dihydrofolate synthase/folylpolyglutamate synthase
MSVGMAFDYFKEKVDIAIIEVGMGGRLDNNIITPLVSVITNIGLDHTHFSEIQLKLLLEKKAGITKLNVPVVIGEYTPTKAVLQLKPQKKAQQSIFRIDIRKLPF